MKETRASRPIKRRGRTLVLAGLAARVGASYGKSLVSRSLGLTPQDQASMLHEKNAARILEAAVALRGPFMKIVQLASIQGEILPGEYLDALSTVQDKAPPLPWREIRLVLEAEFGRPPERVFGAIEPEAIAAASLGQVYRGMLPDGTPVAIKVQYPGVKDAVERDLRVMRGMFKTQKLVGAGLLGNAAFNHDALFADLSDRLHEELDYRREAANIEVFRRVYEDWDWVVVPRVYREFSTDRVLTMDLLDGAPLSTLMRPETPYAERERLVFRMAEMFDHECAGVGVVHADPHPGNRLIGKDGRIGLVDFGCIKVLPRRYRDGFVAATRAAMDRDDVRLLEAARAVGFYREGLDPAPALAWFKFANTPRLADEPYNPGKVDYAGEMFSRMADLARHGYVHYTPHTLFMLRVFFGAAAIMRAFRVTTINDRRRALDFFANRLAQGRRIRDELERDGLIPADL
jgi:predicted unusual protein kinase regulating ubiquinone biosynthesis (AarF/ABC1/UbiB family)